DHKMSCTMNKGGSGRGGGGLGTRHGSRRHGGGRGACRRAGAAAGPGGGSGGGAAAGAGCARVGGPRRRTGRSSAVVSRRRPRLGGRRGVMGLRPCAHAGYRKTLNGRCQDCWKTFVVASEKDAEGLLYELISECVFEG